MATYLQKKVGMFKELKDIKPEKRRSESRLKTYPSSTDVRNWCDLVEDRRQHIIELITKDISKCLGKVVPIEVIVNTLLAMANADILRLRKCLKLLWDFLFSLELSGEKMQKLQTLARTMDKTCTRGIVDEYISLEEAIEEASEQARDMEVIDETASRRYKRSLRSDPGDLEKDECVSQPRHEREKKEIEELVQPKIVLKTLGAAKMPSHERAKGEIKESVQPKIVLKTLGAAKMESKIRGLPSDFQVIPEDRSKPGRITIKAHGSKSKHNTSFSVPSKKTDSPIPSGSPTNMFNKMNIKKETPSDISPDKLAVTEALCKEQQDKIQALSDERDDLKKKLEACMKELDNFKKLQTVTNPLPLSCQEEIAALEAEIKIMRSGNPSPEEEAEIIKREVEVLKRYCSKLKEVENENVKLKEELGSRMVLQPSEKDLEASKIDMLKDKLNNLESLTKERDMLAEKVVDLEKQLMQYQELPDNVELLKNRSNMLDTVLEERDKLSLKVKSVKEMEQELAKYKMKAERVDDLERELKNMSRGDRSSGINLKKSKSLVDNLEKELQNVISERDAMARRIDSMKKELENQKAKATEAEMLRLERDRLQIKLNELSDLQGQQEEMINKIKIFDNIKAERDMYKQKYEEVLEMECTCEMLKAQVDEARIVGRERDQLQKQVQDLETCICEQEDEIKNLVLQVDSISKTKTDRVDTIKKELETKDKLLAVSQDKALQVEQLLNKVNELEQQLHNAEHALIQKDCRIKCLENQVRTRTGSIETSKKLNRRDLESVEQMKKELALATAENKRLQEIANRIMSISGDDHMKKMMKQSECAVKKIVQELGKQYTEWDQMKTRNPKGKYTPDTRKCLCNMEGTLSSSDDCEKLRHELRELHNEKLKLEESMRQIQTPDSTKVSGSSYKNVMISQR